MPIRTMAGNIAHTSAISKRASGVVVAVSNEQFKNEKLYQATMSMVRSMLEKRLITTTEYEQINTIMREKYKPTLGTIFSDIRLT